MKIDRKEAKDVNIPLLVALSNRFYKNVSRREREAVKEFQKILKSGRSRSAQKIAAAEALIPLLREQIKDSRDFFEYSLLIQYDLDNDFLLSFKRDLALAPEEEDLYEYKIYRTTIEGKGQNRKERKVISGRFRGLGDEAIEAEALRRALEVFDGDSPDHILMQRFRDSILESTDETMNSSMAFWRKSMDDLSSDGVALGSPSMQHIAHSAACSFCKMFDLENFRVTSTSSRPHVGCRCSRIPLAHYDLLPEPEWLGRFEEVEAEVNKAAAEKGEVMSYKESMRRIRKAERLKSQGKPVDYADL